jgi:hypothetical protein
MAQERKTWESNFHSAKGEMYAYAHHSGTEYF